MYLALFARILNVFPSKDQEQDWDFENASYAGVLRAPVALPSEIDLRECWREINNQGATGSYVGSAMRRRRLRKPMAFRFKPNP